MDERSRRRPREERKRTSRRRRKRVKRRPHDVVVALIEIAEKIEMTSSPLSFRSVPGDRRRRCKTDLICTRGPRAGMLWELCEG